VTLTHAQLLLGTAAPIWDGLEFFGPYQMLIGDYVRSGRFLLWNPFIAFGSPDAIEPQLGAFSPPVSFFGLVFGGSRHGFEIYWLLVWVLGPLGLLRLARHLGSPVWGAYAASVAWSMCGFYTGHAEHTAWITTMSSLPWILWRLDVAVTSERTWPAVEAGALWGLSALAGYPGLVLLNAAFAVVWGLGRSRRRIHGLTMLAVMGATGLVILSPAYASFAVEGRGYSHRAGPLPFEVAVESNALNPLAMVTLLTPGFALADVYDYTDISSRSLYVGPVVMVLAVVALFARGSLFRWLLLAAGLFALTAAFGHSLPVRGWLYDWVLPTRYFRHAAMFRAYPMLVLTLLAVFGAMDIDSMRGAGTRRMYTAFSACCALTVSALAAFLVATIVNRALSMDGLVFRLQPVGGWGLLSVLCLAVAVMMRGSDPVRADRFRRVKSALPAVLMTAATLDALASAWVMRPIMYSPATTQWRDLDTRHVADVTLTAHGLARVADNGNDFTFAPKIPAASGYAPLTGPLVREYLSEPVLLDAAVGVDRLWFSPIVAEVDRTSACLAELRSAAARMGSPPVVIHRRDAMEGAAGDSPAVCRQAIAKLPAAERLRGGLVQVERYTPERLQLRVRVEQAGWLLVTDSWARGWTAIVNGQPAEVVGANFLFRGVRVGPGTNRIDFRYRPFGYPWLLVLSWGMLALVLAVTIRHPRHPRVPGR